MKKLTAVVIGYGGRGSTYARYAMEHPEELDIVGVAEPNPIRRETAQKRHNIPENRLYLTWEDLAAQPKMADFAIVSTQDNMHYAPALALIDKGYLPRPKNAKTLPKPLKRRVSKSLSVTFCASLPSGELSKTSFWKDAWARSCPLSAWKMWVTSIRATVSSVVTGAIPLNPPA